MDRLKRESYWIVPLVLLLVGLASVEAVFRRPTGTAPPPTPEIVAVRQPIAPATAVTQVMAPVLPPPTPGSAPAPRPVETTTVAAIAQVPAPRTAEPSASQAAVVGEDTLRSGEFDAQLVYDDGTLVTAQLRFDLGGPTRTPRLHLVSAYDGEDGEQRVEQITIGGRSWRREADGAWTETADKTSVIDQVRAFLPPEFDELRVSVGGSTGRTLFRGWNPQRDADVVVSFDPATGAPRQLVEFRRAGGSVRTVLYTGWNTPVTIEPPVSP